MPVVPETRRPGAETEVLVVEAATTLFYERGFHGVSMREIADRVGIRAASLYNHVAGKQELLHRIALGSITELLEGGRRLLADHSRADDRLEAFVRFHVTYHAEHRYRAKVGDDQLHALDRDNLDEVLHVRDAYELVLKQIIEQGRDEEDWQVPDIAVLTFAIATMCTAVGVWYRPGGRLTPEAIADLYVGIARSMVRGAAQRPGRERG